MHIDSALLPAKYAKKCTPILIHFLTVFVHTFTPSFSFFFLFFFKKVHTLAGHYKCGPHLQKVHTYMYTYNERAAAGSIYKKSAHIYMHIKYAVLCTAYIVHNPAAALKLCIHICMH